MTKYSFKILIKPISLLMSNLNQMQEPPVPSFNKGMTLEQYMNNLNFNNTP